MNKCVLIVDDDESVRESLKKLLQGSGYEVVLAAGGLEAAVRFDPEQIDLLLLDLGLPNQSGWDVFERLTARYPCLPVIIITGLPDESGRALAAGVGALFEKPIEVSALLTAIEALLAEPPEVRICRVCGYLQDTRCVTPAGTLGGGGRAKMFWEPSPVPSGSEFSTLRHGVKG
jgi:DNA-binding response OmpR family regulator